MNNAKKSLILCIPIILILIISCASTPEKKIDSVYIMIYDYNNNEVMDVSVFIDDKFVGVTDIYGRLIFPCDEEKESVIRIEKKGYETVETQNSLKFGTVLYFKCGSGIYYAEKAETLLDSGDFDLAYMMIEKALEIEFRKDWFYLKNVILRNVENESE